MKITIAKTAGFCMGVRRAVEMVIEAPSKHTEPIHTYGPLIHNPQVLELLTDKGIRALSHIPEQGTGTILIRAHGVPPQSKADLKAAGYTVVDATCPRVIKVQSIIAKHARQGYAAIIVGDRDHPEVTGLLGYAAGNGHVVGALDDLARLPVFDQAIIVAQTTQNQEMYARVKKWATAHHPQYKIFDTICDSTHRRQNDVRRLASEVDALIVVGGRDSGNTRRLAELAAEACPRVQHIETEDDLDLHPLESAGRIGITAGASTPNWVINRVYRSIESIPDRKLKTWRRALFGLQRSLLLTNIYVATGAGCLCYACLKLLGIGHSLPFVVVAMVYVLSMHILNNLIRSRTDRYNDPGRSVFYRRQKKWFYPLALSAGAFGLAIAYSMGPTAFWVVLAMSLMGLSYNMRILSPAFSGGRYRRIRDIPGSKTVLIALAWGVVVAVFPALASPNGMSALALGVVFLWATGLVFVRTAFFDILDMQGDRIMGKETIPLVFGESQTLTFLKSMLVALPMLLILAAAFNLVPGLAVALAVSPLFLFVVLLFHQQGQMLPGIRLEFLVETHSILAGAITLLWHSIVA